MLLWNWDSYENWLVLLCGRPWGIMHLSVSLDNRNAERWKFHNGGDFASRPFSTSLNPNHSTWMTRTQVFSFFFLLFFAWTDDERDSLKVWDDAGEGHTTCWCRKKENGRRRRIKLHQTKTVERQQTLKARNFFSSILKLSFPYCLILSNLIRLSLLFNPNTHTHIHTRGDEVARAFNIKYVFKKLLWAKFFYELFFFRVDTLSCVAYLLLKHPRHQILPRLLHKTASINEMRRTRSQFFPFRLLHRKQQSA